MRNTYKVISWDAAAGQGLVTDGTSFDGRLQTIVVTYADLQDDAYLQGRLYPGEIISAEEDMNRCADRRLTDILVENGNRSIPSRMDLSMPKNEPFDPQPPPIRPEAPDTYVVTFEDFRELERRVTALEKNARIS